MRVQLNCSEEGLLVLHDLSVGLLLFLVLAYHLTFLFLVFDVVVKEVNIQSGL